MTRPAARAKPHAMTILLTGSSRGIGAAIAERLRADGQAVIGHGTASGIPADFDEPGAAAALWRAALDEAGGAIDILVNNAGITRDAMFHKMTPQQWRDVIDTNLNGVFNMTHPVWPGMRERGFGRIITISSINGQKGQAGQANYSASKAGDIGLTKALAQEGASRNITVNAICPGYIGTEMVRAIPETVLSERILPQIPVGRLGEPDEIARCALFLASDDAGFITGSTLTANGGQYFA